MFKNAFYLALLSLITWGSYQLSYPSNTNNDLFYDGLFFSNITKHIDKLTGGPRGVGDHFHDDAQRYIINQLHAMGLQTVVQKSTSFNPKNRTAAPIRNIIATLPGQQPDNQDLLLLSHYDAVKSIGTGAADDASGVAIILEAVKAMQRYKQQPVNNIILLFTDAEEIGLLGAHAFINEQLRNYDVGLIINLEARGSNGPSMMWPETVGGNRAMIEAFTAANVPMPSTTSLHYEIYKLLPNDTDLSPFNQLAELNGFNLAFIGDHFNYHTELDDLAHLSLDSLAHQTIQFYAMLRYFADHNLSQLQSTDSLVYFSLPEVGLISYPTLVTWLALVLATLIFIGSMVVSCQQQKTTIKTIFAGFLPLILAAGLAGLWAWLVLQGVAVLFPEQQDILQGFPYQGMAIMGAVLFSAAIWFSLVYGRVNSLNTTRSAAPLLLWLLLLWLLSFYLPGSGWLVWPVLLSVMVFAVSLRMPRLAEQMAPIVAVLSFLLLGALLMNLPIAMGLSILPYAAILVVMILALFLPIFSPIKHWSHGLVALVIPLLLLGYKLFQQPSISQSQPHPTSISYLYDTDQKTGVWFNYDGVNSGWLNGLFNQQVSTADLQEFRSRYHKPLKNLSSMESPAVLSPIAIKASTPLRQTAHQLMDVEITAHANTEVLEIFTQQDLTIHAMSINGSNAMLKIPIQLKAGQRLLHYYFAGNKTLEMTFAVTKGQKVEWQLQSHAFDLLDDPSFNLPERPKHQIAKPFIKTDNTIAVQSFTHSFDQ